MHKVKLGLCSSLLFLQCTMTFRKNCFDLLTPSGGCMCIIGQNIGLHCVLCYIPDNLTCNMTTFRKKWPFDPTPGIKGVCKGKIFSKLLYASFPLIWYATSPYSEKKLNLYKQMWPLRWGHFRPKGHNLNKLHRGPTGDATYQISSL